MNKKYYAGIGARSTPDYIQKTMKRIAHKMASCDMVLRSGGAGGADSAFQKGCESWCKENGVKFKKRQRIYLPWDNFNGLRVNKKKGITIERHWFALEIASEFHPKFDTLSEPAKRLMERNTMQIIGTDNTNCELVICWTPDGEASGGTGQAIRFAESLDIPIINLNKPKHLKKMLRWVNKKEK